MNIDELLRAAVAKGASDLHLKVGAYPMMRVSGSLVPVSEEKRLTNEDTLAMGSTMMSPDQREKFTKSQEVDLAYSVAGLGRFRVNIFQQRGTMGMVLRVIPTKILTIEDLLLPPVLRRISEEERGLVLVTGTTGSGKSTTLAAMIDHINRSRCTHVMTVEDPIEFLHRDSRSIVNQREVSVDTRSFAQALRSALRQDPDVILVGEMRDFETIETALLAAETGHLVFSTLHTLDATETINRIIAVYPPHQQKQVRLQLAAVLKAVISQRLIPRADQGGRVPAVEVLVNTAYVRDAIIDKEKTHLIHGAIAQGTSQYGMQTFDQSIFGLFQQGFISLEEALRWASNIDEFKLRVAGISTTGDAARNEMSRGVTGAGEIAGLTRFGS
ncbi:MAG TPA: type IV pilus twitching motility protein PilT [Vicinamibacterales bacterium]|nr:type IV pilus twitching motility protein PilT [Vicinamibacterales bacterium]